MVQHVRTPVGNFIGTGAQRARLAILIATKDGEATVVNTVTVAREQAPVYVVSDGSTDRTAEVAAAAGARVLQLTENVGKPAALRRAFDHFRLAEQFDAVAVVDDDTRLEPGFVVRCSATLSADRRVFDEPHKPRFERRSGFDRRSGTDRRHPDRRCPGRRGTVAIVCGRTKTDWLDELRWNPWVAARAFAYWRYQLFTRKGLSALGVMNTVSGSNSAFDAQFLTRVLHAETPYIVDDTYWVLEAHRQGAGRVVYDHYAVGNVQDPITLRSWYRQNLRWMHGTFQGVWGHKIGRRLTFFDAMYVGQIVDWALYLFLWPLLLVALVARAWGDWGQVGWLFGVYAAGYLVWAVIGAAALRRWRLVPLFPALIFMDWANRVNMVHAIGRTVRQPRSECRWVSPVRVSTSTLDPAIGHVEARPRRAPGDLVLAMVEEVT